MSEAAGVIDPDEARRRVDQVPVWYHTIDVAPGVTTPGHFDLRPIVDDLPWPNLTGKRCLDVATFDGFFAFEMERRGAAEVVAIDIGDLMSHDWPLDYRDRARADLDKAGLAPPGTGFRTVAGITGSSVQWRDLSVYDLDPAAVGMFDVVFCGSLLIHLRDPLRALEAIRLVTSGFFLSAELIAVGSSLVWRRRPVFTLNGSGPLCQWFTFNAAGHERMLEATGFDIVERGRPYTDRLNEHPPLGRRGLRRRVRRAAVYGLTGATDDGVLHRALLARPRP